MRNERLTFGHRIHGPVPARPVALAAMADERQPFRFTHPETWDWGWGGLLIFSILLFFRPQDQITALGRAHISDLSAMIGLVAMVFVNPVWLQFLSHKLGRLFVPYALVGAFVASAALATTSWVYGAAFAAQLAFYGLAAYGGVLEQRRRAARPHRREVIRDAA